MESTVVRMGTRPGFKALYYRVPNSEKALQVLVPSAPVLCTWRGCASAMNLGVLTTTKPCAPERMKQSWTPGPSTAVTYHEPPSGTVPSAR